MNNRWFGRLAGACLTAVLALSPLCRMNSLAAGTEALDAPYDYQITFYAGNQGAFSAGPAVSVQGVDGKRRDVPVEAGADAIVVKGLKAGDLVTFDPIQDGAVLLDESSPYYVRGLRRAGGDNDDEKPSSFRVAQDQDYVVAYGVKGEQVSYVIRYEDASGRKLADDRTYYGNVGDRPVIAFRYIEGYEPQAYNLTKTLSKNEAENVFTFVYSRVRTGGGSSSGGGSGSGGGTPGDGTAAAPGADGGAAGGQPGTAGGQTGTVGAAGDGAAGAGAAAGGTAGAGDAEEAGGDGAGTDVPDTEVPADEGPRDLVDLDDEETPLAEAPALPEAAKAGAVYSLPVLAGISLLLAVVLVIYAGYRYRMIRRRSGDEEEDDE